MSLAIIIGLMLVTKVIKFNGLSSNIKVIYIVLFFFGYLIQSTMEELFCRGYLLHRLKNKVPVLYAVIISFLAFSIGHFSKMFGDGFLIGLFGCINLFLISMIWSILTLKDKNIYSAIGYHFIWNFTLFNIIGLNLSGLDITTSIFDFSVNKNFLAGASYGIESTIFTLVILLIILGVLLYGYLKNKKD